MGRDSETRQTLAVHATRAMFTRYAIMGGLAIAMGVGTVALGSPWGGVSLLAFGGTFAVLGVWGRSVGHATQCVNAAYIAIGRRRYDEAEALLVEAERASHASAVRRAAALQRGIMAMRRGEVSDAIASLDASMGQALGILTGSHEQMQVTCARGMRSFLRACEGEGQLATQDAQAVMASADASGEALGFAALAELILVERSGDRDALRRQLADRSSLLLEATGARERVIVRAYQRMLRTGAHSVYRVGAPPDVEAAPSEEPTLTDWVDRMVPAVAPFMRPERPTATVAPRDAIADMTPPSAEAVIAVAAARRVVQRVSARPSTTVALWGVIAIMFTAIWYSDDPHPSLHSDAVPEVAVSSSWSVLDFGAAVPLLLVGVFGATMIRHRAVERRDFRVLTRAGALQAAGRLEEASTALDELVGSRRAATRASAHHLRSRIAQRQAKPELALEHAELGMRGLGTPQLRAAASDLLWPGLVEERAVALAALDRHDEANAELATLAEPYPFIERARLRVRMVQLVRTDRIDDGARLVMRWDRDQALSRREELLVDLLCAAGTPEAVDVAERERLQDELRDYAEGRRWLEVVAPGALAAFARSEEVGDPVAP